LLVDTLGLIWGILITPASETDGDAAETLLEKVHARLPRLQVIWADQMYRSIIEWVKEQFQWCLSVVLRPLEAVGFVLLPHRWVVERTFAWLGKYRRLSKDYEANPKSSEAWIQIAMIHRMVRKMIPDHEKSNRWTCRKPRRKTLLC
jgi:putative transposase